MLIKEALDLIKEEEELKDQNELAAILKVSQPTISNYYKGTTYPQLDINARVFGKYGHRCEPHTEWALEKEWNRLKEYEV